MVMNGANRDGESSGGLGGNGGKSKLKLLTAIVQATATCKWWRQ